MAVVAVTNLPEPGTAEEAEGIKGDLIRCVHWPWVCPVNVCRFDHHRDCHRWWQLELSIALYSPQSAHPHSLFNQVGGGVQEVHLKPGAATAFVVLADPRDLAEAIRAVDWHEYAGRKLRVARSNKRVF